MACSRQAAARAVRNVPLTWARRTVPISLVLAALAFTCMLSGTRTSSLTA